jgi:hypothetical protein
MGAAGHRPMDWTEIVVYGLISAAIAFVLLFYVHKAWIFAPKPA